MWKKLTDEKLGGREIQELANSAQRITVGKDFFDNCLQNTLNLKLKWEPITLTSQQEQTSSNEVHSTIKISVYYLSHRSIMRIKSFISIQYLEC